MRRALVERRFGAGALACVLVCAGARGAHAAVDLGQLARGGVLPSAVGAAPSTIVQVPAGAAVPAGFVRIGVTPAGATLGVLDLDGAGLSALALGRPELSLAWSPPLRLLLDRADGLTGASQFRNDTGLTGQGVVLGIVDTGLDVTHPDLRDAAGRSRVLWWLDFSRERAGRHPELEDALGCRADATQTNGVPCAVFDSADLDELLADGDASNDPHDLGGHGTHVASLAGGNGRSNTPARFVGVAPEASFIVARVARAGGGIYDADVLRAASFVFARAEERGMPAVVNLSLGTDFGGHDGTTPVELGLSSLVGPEHPGRAIVVAAGNSAGLYSGFGGEVPEPLGIHTEVHVAAEASALVPIVTPATGPGVTEGTVFVWLTLLPGDDLAVGVEDRGGTLLGPVPRGSVAQKKSGGVEVTIINGVTDETSPIPPGSYSAAVVLDGRWSSKELFGLRLDGLGSARIWVEGDGMLGPAHSIGPLLPRAQKAGTINVPATAPALIAVGATVNRLDYTDYAGEAVSLAALGPPDDAPVDTPAFFSSGGPTALGVMKPDLVAPGANVIGAMAADADPRAGSASELFDDGGMCASLGYADGCFVVDDRHALAGGTSMSAPLVSGAIALLFERDRTLDEAAVKALLQAGARRIARATQEAQQIGAGALDLSRTLQALDEGTTLRVPGERTELVLADSYVHPDRGMSLEGFVELRDDGGDIVDGFDARRLALRVAGGELVEPLVRLAPGLWRFALTAPAGSGGRTLALAATFDGRTLAQTTLPIAVDRALAGTLPSARGGCALAAAPGAARVPAPLALLALALLCGLRARRDTRWRRAARTARRPDRTDGPRRPARGARPRR